MIKWSLHQEDIANLKRYASNNKAVNNVKPKVMELKVNTFLMIFENLNALFSPIDRRIRQKDTRDRKLNILNKHSLVYIEHFSQHQQNPYSFQVAIEYTPR